MSTAAPTGIGVLTVTQEPQTAKAVAEAISAAGGRSLALHHSVRGGSKVGVCRTLDELLITLEGVSNTASAVVVDIDPKPLQMLSDLEPIVNRWPGTRFVVISSDQRSELMLHAMQVGVRHFIAKNKIDSDLRPVLQRLTPIDGGSRNGWHGSIVTILSAGGGCGATTFAINLATELNGLTTQPTLLIDMDSAYGAAAGYLGLNAQYGLADVLADGDRIDANLVRSTAVVHSPQLHVLASPATVDIDNPAPLALTHMARAWQKAREAYTYTVVDAPRAPVSVASTLAVASQMTYIVLEMNVEHIRVARALHGGLVNRGVSPERILPLVNRYRGRREMITLQDAQKAIGCERLGTLSNDYKGVISSINFGKPLAEVAPRSLLRTDVQNLAKGLREHASKRTLAGAH